MKKNINVNLFLQGEGGRKSGGRRGLTSASFNESSQSGSRIVSNRYVWIMPSKIGFHEIQFNLMDFFRIMISDGIIQ